MSCRVVVSIAGADPARTCLVGDILHRARETRQLPERPLRGARDSPPGEEWTRWTPRPNEWPGLAEESKLTMPVDEMRRSPREAARTYFSAFDRLIRR